MACLNVSSALLPNFTGSLTFEMALLSSCGLICPHSVAVVVVGDGLLICLRCSLLYVIR